MKNTKLNMQMMSWQHMIHMVYSNQLIILYAHVLQIDRLTDVFIIFYEDDDKLRTHILHSTSAVLLFV